MWAPLPQFYDSGGSFLLLIPESYELPYFLEGQTKALHIWIHVTNSQVQVSTGSICLILAHPLLFSVVERLGQRMGGREIWFAKVDANLRVSYPCATRTQILCTDLDFLLILCGRRLLFSVFRENRKEVPLDIQSSSEFTCLILLGVTIASPILRGRPDYLPLFLAYSLIFLSFPMDVSPFGTQAVSGSPIFSAPSVVPATEETLNKYLINE